MPSNYSLHKDGSFVIKNYSQAHPFSNFLPGISGQWGIPLWAFYVNRGQGIVSFGIKDKDHTISEFFPANKAYSFVPLLGFRTFLKINNKIYYEPFKPNHSSREDQMIIGDSYLEIREINHDLKLSTDVKYFTLPNTYLGGLVRKVTIKNNSDKNINLEALDGLSRIIPFGSANYFLKDMSRTLEAWMHTKLQSNLALFRLIIDPKDVSQTKYIEGANFNYSFYEDRGKKVLPYLIVDPAAVFGADTSFLAPDKFLSKNFKVPLEQITCGRTPCAFTHFKVDIQSKKTLTLYSIFGASFEGSSINKFVTTLDANFITKKEEENDAIVKAIKNNALCVSGLKEFDYYVKNTYLDNVLRGGYPYYAKSKKLKAFRNPYYIFSRKHGDLERDYNYFQLQPSYFSEGEANYRDINQNRRMDLFFEPSLGTKNIQYFLNFIKIDGYNPLVVKGEKLYFNRKTGQDILKEFRIRDQKLLNLMVRGFYLGEFFKLLEEEEIKIKQRDELVFILLKEAKREPQAQHNEGYWIDHWHYNLDLIENFLYFFPDKLEGLFWSKEFIFWDDEHKVKPRKYRYILRSGRVYQGESLEVLRPKRLALKERGRFKNFLRTKSGKIYRTNLVVKLLSLVLNKSATFDPDGVGIEMEADKPGWCDSFNGLPALFGSSLSETLALKRLVILLLKVLSESKKEGKKEITVPQEVAPFYKQLNKLLLNYLSNPRGYDYIWWDKTNSAKEEFRKKTYFYLEGKEKKIKIAHLEIFLKNLLKKINNGIQKAYDKKSGLYFTYFSYSATKYTPKNKHLTIQEFSRRSLPLSLEGMVHILRTEPAKGMHSKLLKSPLFDRELKMYRLNASLKGEPLEIGRGRIFVPGWLENESIWLHMEYKYLLELLKNGLYEDFFKSFYTCGICFMDPKTYGRSILENSSFIVSSVYPDKTFWGRGFAARLSGATAELLNLWILLCLGKEPFFIDKKGELSIRFCPILKKEFFTVSEEKIDFLGQKVILPKNTFSFNLFSETLVCYHNPNKKDTFNKACEVERIEVEAKSNEKTFCSAGIIKFPLSLMVRNSEIRRIDVYLK